jgi:glycosyltransferase involved in cell wall biosynthesis
VLAPEAPYPIVGGGPLRTASIIEYFRTRYSVHVVTFQEPGAPDLRPYFPPDVAVNTIELPFHGKTPAARAFRNLGRAIRGTPPLVDRFGGFDSSLEAAIEGRRYRVGVIEHLWCAPYAHVLRPRCDRLLLNLHNIESVLLERSAAVEVGPIGALLRHFAHASARLEREWLPRFDDVLVTSDADRLVVPGVARVYPNTIPLQPLPHVPKRHEIVFSGNLEYPPNQAAIRWFHDHIWPDVRRRCAGLEWRLLGRNSDCCRRKMRDERITFSGPVDDAVRELAAAEAAIVPVISGSGTRLKIVEAWAAGLPVVSTTLGAEGLPCTPGVDILLADDPAKFADVIVKLLRSDELRTHLGFGGRRLYERRLTWDAAWSELTALGL